MTVRALDLFCGIGGLTYGMEQSGIEVTAGFDFDRTCKETYESNSNSLFFEADVATLEVQQLNDLWGDADIRVLMGCAPCQPFSTHQKDKKNRSKHKDWGLLYQFQRLVRDTLPEIVSMENVPTLAKEAVFKDFVNGLTEIGYSVHFEIINAADYGVPQRRRRLLLLASRLPNKDTIRFINPTNINNYTTVQDTIGNLPHIEAGEYHENDIIHYSSKLSDLNLRRIMSSSQGGTWKEWPEDLILDCHKKDSGKTYTSVYGRMSWDDVAPTMTTQFTKYGTGRFGHPTQNRAISLREGALLQSFPLEYHFYFNNKVSRTDIGRHIGNAVPPRLGEVIGLSILQHINEREELNNND